MTRTERNAHRWPVVLAGAAALLIGATPVAAHDAASCNPNTQRHTSTARQHTSTRRTAETRRKPVVDEWLIVRQVPEPTVVERRTTVETVPQPVTRRTIETIEED